jgi:hypothetical protein
MAELVDVWTVDLGSRVQDLPALTQMGKVATPIIARAEQLCDALDAAGEHRPDRYFLISALVATTEPDTEDLAARLRRYRQIKVHEALIGQTSTEGEVTLPRARG